MDASNKDVMGWSTDVYDQKLFEPEKPITRIEAYTLLMKGVCLVDKPVPDESWTQTIHKNAKEAGLTDVPFSSFRPSSSILKKEVFTIASQLTVWADKTGGCQPKVCQ
mgnify:CR=1 FL=1